MLHFGPDASLDLLDSVYQRINEVVFLVQLFTLARAHRHVPSDTLLDIRALLRILVTASSTLCEEHWSIIGLTQIDKL